MPHVSPRERNKRSENKMQPYRQRPSSSPPLWNDPLLAQGARAHSKPTLSLPSLHNSHHSPMFLFPFPTTPPLSQCQGQGSRAVEHLGAANWQLSWSHVVKSPKALALQLPSEELMNDKWQESNHAYSSVHSYLPNDVQASQKFCELQGTWEDI